MANFSRDISSTEHVAFRPRHNLGKGSALAADRLLQCENVRNEESLRNKGRAIRRSKFREEGLDEMEIKKVDVKRLGVELPTDGTQTKRRKTYDTSSKHSKGTECHGEVREDEGDEITKARPTIPTSSNAPPSTFSSVPRFALIAFLIAVVVPGMNYGGREQNNMNGADAGVIREAEMVENGSAIEGRANSPTDVCTRWAHMTANVNGTLYVYGGEATTTSGQTTNTWNNDLLALDLTKTWEISSPSLTGLAQPSGPPAVAMGSLWHTYSELFLYGGLFSDSPATSPSPVSTWKYDIAAASWTEYTNPQTAAGNNSDTAPVSVNRAAEGAGLSVPELGRSWYFGGHLDMYTTPGWSNQIARVYLKGLLEFTHPGYTNNGVTSLGTTKGAGDGGVYRNITEGGLQDSAGFTERADGVLVYVPGWGVDGILLGLAGGTNETYTEMNVIDIYDIASSTWYKQSTSGATPPIRVDPCAVVAAAPDGSSFNVYLYGGQNLIPYGDQTQYSDMWILTIPSFTWIEVDMSSQSQPAARAGHSCNIMDGQIVVVGGYVGTEISCDSPGVYVFNASSLEWTQSFTALTSSSLTDSSSSEDEYSEIMMGSTGYTVPDIVQSVIGGSPTGGATATIPAAGSATAGPLATGKAPTFTQTTGPATATSTITSTTAAKKSTNIAAIVAGVVAAGLGILAGYLAFCTWLYRKQLKVYKQHVAVAQRAAFNPAGKMWVGDERSSREKGAMANGTEMTEMDDVMLGPFGTTISSTTPPRSGRPSTGSVSGSGSGRGGVKGEGGVWAYGGGIMPGGNSYHRISEEDSVGGGRASGGTDWARTANGSAHSSVDDLLAGQEPSFFSVVLNPRRTLRVVNSD